MSDVLLDEQAVPTTPAAGTGIMYVDNGPSLPAFKNDGGLAGVMSGLTKNASVADQAISAADTYITDSDLLIPSFGVQARTVFRWLISVSKTAAGTATPIYTVRIGSARTVADTARLTLTGPAQTAATDTAVIEVILVVRNVGASGVIQGTVYLHHLNTATGFANNVSAVVQAASAAFDNSALAGLYVGLSINNGASGAWTVTQVQAEAIW